MFYDSVFVVALLLYKCEPQILHHFAEFQRMLQAFIVQMPFLMPMMQMVPAPAPVQRYMPLEGLTGPTAPVEMKEPMVGLQDVKI